MRAHRFTVVLSLAPRCLGALLVSSAALAGCGDAMEEHPAGIEHGGVTADFSGNATTPLVPDPMAPDPVLTDPAVPERSHPPLAHHIEPTVTPEPPVLDRAGADLSSAEPAPPLRERSYVNEYAEQQTYLESLAVEREHEEAEREREERAEMRTVPIVE